MSKRDRYDMEREIAGKRQEWNMLQAARKKRVKQEERRLGRKLTWKEKADVEWNTKVPNVIEMLLGLYPKKLGEE